MPDSVTSRRMLLAGVLAAVAGLRPARAQYGDPSLGSRIGNPEAGGAYREDLGRRVGPSDRSGRRPFSIQERINPDEGLDRRPLVRSPEPGSSAAARRAARQRYLDAQARRRREAEERNRP